MLSIDRTKIVTVFSVIAVLFVVFTALDIQDASPESVSVEVIDCRNSSFTCNETSVERKPSSCGIWHPWDSYGELNCNYTEKDLGQVSLVADPANYIESPMTVAEYDVSVVSETKPELWDLELLPSGDKIWTRLQGELVRLEDGERKTLAELEVPQSYKAGLMGLAVDPDYESNGYIYLFYTDSRTNMTTEFLNKTIWNNRVSRFRLEDGELTDETVLLELPGAGIHNGGRLEFGPGGKLYVATGESFTNYRASEKSFLGGKVLRINRNGSIPGNNPFDDSPVYSMGHRNPQGLAWSLENQLYQSEHGLWRKDEINSVESGRNYGWSGYGCSERMFYGSYRDRINTSLEQFYDNTPPVRCFENWTMAPSGMVFVDDKGHPWHGDLFVAGLRGKHLRRFTFEDKKISKSEIFYVSDDEEEISLRLRDVEYHDGSLYVAGDQGGIVRLDPR